MTPDKNKAPEAGGKCVNLKGLKEGEGSITSSFPFKAILSPPMKGCVHKYCTHTVAVM